MKGINGMLNYRAKPNWFLQDNKQIFEALCVYPIR